ncbi:MAG TPA: carboxypeptidase-like regulatory domain-containing protein [Gemmatimonadaceae bacterium]|nr:carboxypeptidase-like regulatory domain-containing protein [Gemmatimonadaceae bacterium]
MKRFLLSLSFAIGGFSGAFAQTPAPASGFAVVEGVAIDSLHQDFLRGAVLTVEGAASRAVTDSLGRYRLDSVPPGVRRIEVIHPLLDTVGVTLVTAPLQLAAGQRLRLVVSTPSIETILAMKCTTGERSIGPVVLIGTVAYAETETPAAKAKVSLAWVEHEVTRKSVAAIAREKSADVGADGRFRICGLPADVSGSLIAALGADSTSAVDVHVQGALGVVGLVLPEPRESPAATNARATLTGRVLDIGGRGLARARVAVDADTSYALTGSDGRFTIHNLHTGTRLVSVRRLGFEPTQLPVDLHATKPSDVTIRMGEFVPQLDPVTIRAARETRALQQVGFVRRKQIASGFFMTPEEIEKRNAFDVTDLLRAAPMLRMSSSARGTVVAGRTPRVNVGAGNTTSFSNSCVSYFVDGVHWNGSDVNDFVTATDIAAIEVYAKTFTPAKFRTGFDDCETVVIWTKQKVK